MALVECRRFPTLPQAQVASSALSSAGLHPYVFDEFRASMLWTEQFALNGIRVMVPDDELAVATEILGEDPPAGPIHHAARIRGASLSFAMWAALAFLVGWPVAGFKRPGLFHRVTAAVATVLILAMVALTYLRHS